MKLYTLDMQICATAYIKADSPEEALTKANQWLADAQLEVAGVDGDTIINGLRLDDPELPEVSISPAMTILGPFEGDIPEETDERIDVIEGGL